MSIESFVFYLKSSSAMKYKHISIEVFQVVNLYAKHFPFFATSTFKFL